MSRNTPWSIAERARVGAGARPVVRALLALLSLGALLACALALAAADAVPEFVRAELGANDATARTSVRALGQGRMRWFGLHIYDAALYAVPPFAADRVSAQPFVLELTYARTLSGHDIAVRSRDEIARLGLGTEAQREQWLAQMAKTFPDVKDGDRIAGVNHPGAGTRFYFNGKLIGTIEDPEFGPAFFAIWLDARTSAPAVRADLLKDASGS